MNLTTPTSTQPWLITLEAYRDLASAPWSSPPRDNDKKEDPKPQYTVRNGVAVIPIHGTMMRQVRARLRTVAEYCGIRLCDMQETAEAIRAASLDPALQAVVLDIDSPGGTVNGTPELAHAVEELCGSKHVYAYTSGMCCSAAYWVASQADAIYAAPSAIVGSIGVLLPVLDCTALYEQEGLKLDVFAAGKYKSIGLEGTSLSDEQRALLEGQVQATWAEFKQAVNRRRRVDGVCMEGQCFSGAEAQGKGLVDAIAYSKGELLDKLAMRHAL